ncbi:MAG: DNA polymerase I [Deltaproteobacteria bacterium]
MTEPILYLIDASSYVFRAFHGVRGLATSRGFPTNALFGYSSMLMKFIKGANPRYIAAVFDSKDKTFRHEYYPLYKAGRSEPPDELKIQFPRIFDITRAIGVADFQMEGFEADDIIGTFAKSAERDGISVVIVTGDKDFCQIVSDKITLFDTMHGRRTGARDVEEKFGVLPERVVDVLALSGDSVDNIPGARGIGDKTASGLIKKFGSLDSLYANLDSLSPRQREILINDRDKVILSKALATIDIKVPIAASIADFKYEGARRDELRALFEEFEFHSLLRDALKSEAAGPVNRPAGFIRPLDSRIVRAQESEKSPGGADADTISYDNYRLVSSGEALAEVIEAIARTGELSIDLETTSLSPIDAEIVGVALCHAPGEAHYVPVGHSSLLGAPAAQLKLEFLLDKLKPLLESDGIRKIGQNLKYEYIILRRHGIELRGISSDAMIAAHTLDSSRMSYSLDELSRIYLAHKTITYEDVTGSGKGKIAFDQVDLERARVYSCEDADVALALERRLSPDLDNLGLMDNYRQVELRFIPVLADMESCGVGIDSRFLGRLSVEFEKGLDRIAEGIYSQVGERFNLNSPAQLREILFERIGLPRKKLTKGGEASTDVEVLSELAEIHEVPARVLEHRGLMKLKSTYVDALPRLVNPKTGRIHTSFNQTGTTTGRLSSSEPNLQNIPIKTPEGRRIREAFVPEEGFVMLSADYSQIELRLLAHFSGDENLIEAFLRGADIHTRTGAEIFGVDEKSVTPDMRRLAKTINFGIIYGISAFGLARQLGSSNTVAKGYIDEYFKRYGGVKSYMERSIEEARGRGFAETILGRRRPIPELASKDRTLRGFGERTAINTPIQGTAADIIKIAMIKIRESLRGYKSRMILQVHDELLFEVHEDELYELRRIVKAEMEGAWKLSVPLSVEMGVGANWAEAH